MLIPLLSPCRREGTSAQARLTSKCTLRRLVAKEEGEAMRWKISKREHQGTHLTGLLLKATQCDQRASDTKGEDSSQSKQVGSLLKSAGLQGHTLVNRRI